MHYIYVGCGTGAEGLGFPGPVDPSQDSAQTEETVTQVHMNLQEN